jgi:prepilin-type N-terminal cleavage/methylation domain-containing protein
MSRGEITLRSKSAEAGFTLLEILIAVAIIAVIVSMVYGSYFAAARSTEAYDATMEVSEQARQALAQMARQIRCAYAPQSVHRVEQMQQASGAVGESVRPEKLISRDKSSAETGLSYFSGGVDGPAGEVLQFVTTDGSSAGPQLSNGLFEVIYRFDKSSGLLSLSQQRFIERLQSPAGHRNWQPVLTGVERFELTFYDGQKWLSKWDFKEKRRPPLATKVEITCEDKNNRRCRLATTAYVPCHKNQGKNMAADTLVSVDEKWD